MTMSSRGGGLLAKLCLTLATPWTVACLASLPIGFSRPEYRSGLPFLSPGDLPDPGMKPRSPALQADSLPTELEGSPNVILVLCFTWLCLTLLRPCGLLPPGSSVHRISQARILEWVAISYSRGSSRLRVLTWVSYLSCTGCIGRWILFFFF